jgi:hypothetical protein
VCFLDLKFAQKRCYCTESLFDIGFTAIVRRGALAVDDGQGRLAQRTGRHTVAPAGQLSRRPTTYSGADLSGDEARGEKEEAELNSEIVQALETEAAEAERRRQLGHLRKELDRFAASLPPVDDSAPLIREDRER